MADMTDEELELAQFTFSQACIHLDEEKFEKWLDVKIKLEGNNDSDQV
jgi:hypothetical protein